MAVVSWWSDSKSDQSSPGGAFGALASFASLISYKPIMDELREEVSSISFIPKRGFTSGTHGPM